MGKKIFIIGICLAVIGGIIFVYSLAKKKPDAVPPAESHEGHNHSDESESKKPMHYKDVVDMLCDHNIRTIECNECRYEAGVVKVEPTLLKSPDNPNGIIQTEKIRKEKPFLSIEVVGEIEPDPNKTIHIRAKTAGVIKSLKSDLGQYVKTGTTIFEMDSNEYRELHLEFLRFSAFLRLAEKNYERENRLFAKKLTTEKEFLEAQSEVERIKIELDTTIRKLQLLGLSPEEIKKLPQHTDMDEPCCLPVRTPLDGIVIERHIIPGELVEANTDLMTISDLSTLWVWVNLYEKDLAILHSVIRSGPIKAEVRVATYPDKIFSGQVDYIADQMDEHTRTVRARIVLENTEQLLKIRMFVHCRLLIPSEKEMLVIPKEALLKDGDETFIFTQVSKDLFFKQPVKIGHSFSDSIEITEGVTETDTIVVNGAFLLKSDVLREKMGAGCAD